MTRVNKPWNQIQWNATRPASPLREVDDRTRAFIFDEAVPSDLGIPSDVGPFVVGTSPLEEAQTLLSAGAEVEHALLVQYLYAAWSLAGTPVGSKVLDIAVQEMCHFVTVQNLLLFAGGSPNLSRQDQDPAPELDPYPFTLRPLTKGVLEDFLLAEMPGVESLSADQLTVMQPILDRHQGSGQTVHPVGRIYARLYWLFLDSDEPTADWPTIGEFGFPAGRHIGALPASNSALTFQVDPASEPNWKAQQDRGGVFQNIDSRAAAQGAIAAIATQGEGSASGAPGASHFAAFLDIYANADLDHLSVTKMPTDPFVAAQPAADSAREANRITHLLAVALCGVFDYRYRIMLTSIRAALSRDRTNPADLAIRTKYTGWALDEMLGNVRMLAGTILRLPCKANGTVTELTAAPTFTLDNFALPDVPAALDQSLLALHRAAAIAITAALAQNPNAGAKIVLQTIQTADAKRYPGLLPA
jgi:hypothetical protein